MKVTKSTCKLYTVNVYIHTYKFQVRVPVATIVLT